jgi:protein TonB
VASPPRQVEFRFQSLVLTEPESLAKPRSATLSFSLLVHTVLVIAFILLPLLWEEGLPVPDNALRAFFVAPADLAPPPPPPPPPPAGARAVTRAPAAPRPQEEPKFVAPIEVPTEVKPDEGIDLGVEGGVPGGVEGGVPGGVVGGIIGGLPAEAPAPPKVVRIGGQLVAPKLLHRVVPEYPPLATVSRVSAIVIIEAHVDVHGAIKSVKVLRGHPLFDDAAMAAVRQWRYVPLLLNGQPTEFILTVTLSFNLMQRPQASG